MAVTRREDPADPRPHSRLTAQVRRDVMVDRVMLRVIATTAGRAAQPGVLTRIASEINQASALFEERGWLAAPAAYHAAPPAPDGVRRREATSRGLRHTTVTWPDDYAPRPDEPGAARYASYDTNRIARATLLEHRGRDRPWLLCIHGFGMGSPAIDLRGFRARHLYRDLGLNLAFLTLPFHGRRGGSRRGLPPFPGVDLLDDVHGLAQSVWDARQLLQHLGERTDHPIALMGMSLGGCVAALVASVVQVHAALLLIPVADLAALMLEAAQRYGGELAADVDLTDPAERVMRPVCPLALTPRVPRARRFLVAGTLDRFVKPGSQAVALWRHWDEPETFWYHGGHVSMFWARGVQAAVDDELRKVFDLA